MKKNANPVARWLSLRRALPNTVAVCCLSLFTSGQGLALDSSDFVAGYSFDDGTATDQSGNGLDGELVGGPTPAEGRVNGALEFDGSDDMFVRTPDLGEVDELTIATWFKMTGRESSWRVFYNVDGWSAGWVHHQLHPNNMIEFSIHSNPGGNDTFGETVFDAEKLDEWHHSAVVYSSSEETIKFYVDGELDNEQDWGGNPAVLGPAEIGAWDGGGRGFEGLLDEFIILKIAATEEQVKELASGDSVFDNSDPNAGGFGSAVNFGRVPILATDQDLSFTIKNSGAENTLTLSDYQLTGEDAAFFTLAEMPSEVPPKGSADVLFKFNPQGELRPFFATLAFTTNDPDEDDQNITLPISVIVNNPDAPIVHYRLDETDAGAEVADSTGEGHVGVYRTDAGTVTVGQPGLTAETGTSVAVSGGGEIQGDSSFFPELDSFSIALWTNLSALGDIGNQDFGTVIGLGATNPEFALLVASGEVMWFGDSDGNADVIFASTTQPITVDTTHHVVLTYDDETGDGRILVDGAEAAAGPVPDFERDGSLYFGAFGSGALGMSGRLDDIQIYDRVLSDEDIDRLINAPGKVLAPVGDVDSDGDGLLDADEVGTYDTDPLVADTDEDGVNDGDEIVVHKTDPLTPDTDGDGFSDGFEVDGGHDPLDDEVPNVDDLLLVLYDFEDGAGTSVANIGNQEGAGTIVNPEKGEWRTGSPSSGGPGYLYFDGVDGGIDAIHVDTGFGADVLGISGENDYTAMAWMNVANTDGDNMVFGQAVDENVLHHGTRDAQYYMGHWGNDIGGGSAEVDVWHHVAWRYEDGEQEILVDGVRVAGAPRGALTVNANVVIGTTRAGDDRDFHGGIDEVRIYNTALSDELIWDIVGLVPPEPDPDRGPVGHWAFNEGSGTTTADASEGGNDGTLVNATWEEDPERGTVLAFDGDAWVATGDGITELGNADFTYSAWIKTGQAGGNIISKQSDDAEWEDSEKKFYVSPGEGGDEGGAPAGALSMVGWGVDWVAAGEAAVDDDTWHHVALTFQRDLVGSDPGRIYVDGVEVGSYANQSFNGKADNADDLVYIGRTPGGEEVENFVGLIDEVSIWDRVLSADEIAALAAPPGAVPELRGYWAFDEGEGNTTADLSAGGHDGTLENAAWANDADRGTVLEFDGNAWVATGDGIAELGDADFSYSAWIKTDQSGVNIISKQNDNAEWEDSEKKFYVSPGDGDDEGGAPAGGISMVGWGVDWVAAGEAVVTDNEWHHVVLTFQRDLVENDPGRIYIDGVEVGSYANQSYNGKADNPGDLVYIGRTPGGEGVENFVGQIDDVSIWQGVLTPEHAQQLASGVSPLELSGGGDPGGGDPGDQERIAPIVIAGEGSFGLQFTGADGQTYDIEYSENLIDWEVLESGLSGDVMFEDSDATRLSRPSGYYRGVEN